MTADELAAPTGAQPTALHRLQALTGLDVLTRDGDRFALTTLGQSLRSGSHSVAESARFLGSPFVWSVWGALGDAIMDGQAAFRHAHGIDMFDYVGTHPDALESFQALMSSQSRLQTATWPVATSRRRGPSSTSAAGTARSWQRWCRPIPAPAGG